MNKKILTISFILIGLFLVAYGSITAAVSNEAEIITRYECGRITKDARSTDKYCHNPSSAPEAKKNFNNPFVYTGAAVFVLGGLYMAINLKKK